jgi:hypothetical protein
MCVLKRRFLVRADEYVLLPSIQARVRGSSFCLTERNKRDIKRIGVGFFLRPRVAVTAAHNVAAHHAQGSKVRFFMPILVQVGRLRLIAYVAHLQIYLAQISVILASTEIRTTLTLEFIDRDMDFAILSSVGATLVSDVCQCCVSFICCLHTRPCVCVAASPVYALDSLMFELLLMLQVTPRTSWSWLRTLLTLSSAEEWSYAPFKSL